MMMKLEWRSCLATLWDALTPFVAGLAIAYLLNILMCFYEKHYFPKAEQAFFRKSRRPVCLLVSFATLIAVTAVVVNMVVPQLISCGKLLFQQLSALSDDMPERTKELEPLPDWIETAILSVDWKEKIEEVLSVAVSSLGSIADVITSMISSVFSLVVTLLLGIVFSIYLLMGKERLQRQAKRLMQHYLKQKWYDKIVYVFSVIHDCFRRYIIGQCLEAIILGSLCTIGMLIFRFPYALMIGALIAFTALIPIAGAYIGAGIGFFLIFTVSPFQACMFLVFIVVLQQIEGKLIYPRVVGASIGLPGIWVLFAVVVGGKVLGIFGMMIGVPLAAVLYRLIREAVQNGEKQKENERIGRDEKNEK